MCKSNHCRSNHKRTIILVQFFISFNTCFHYFRNLWILNFPKLWKPKGYPFSKQRPFRRNRTWNTSLFMLKMVNIYKQLMILPQLPYAFKQFQPLLRLMIYWILFHDFFLILLSFPHPTISVIQNMKTWVVWKLVFCFFITHENECLALFINSTLDSILFRFIITFLSAIHILFE